MTEIVGWLSGLAPGSGSVQVAVFLIVLVVDLLASVVSTLAAVIGGPAPARVGYASSMGALLGGIVWLLAAFPHGLLMALLAGMAMSAIGYG